MIRRMIGFYNHLRNSEITILLNGLQLSIQLNKDGESSWVNCLLKIDETLGTPIDHLTDTEVLLSKKLNECLEQLLH